MNYKNQNGYTLIELMTTVVILGVSFMTVFFIFKVTMDIYTSVAGMSEDIQRIQQVSNYLEADIKNLKDKNSILIATSSQFKFVNVNNVTIDMVFTGSQFKKNTVVLNSDISTAQISYYKWDGSSWTSARPLSEIARLVFSVSFTSNGEVVPFNHSILLRNCR
jgi:prepilin-type N-terminal cleavage/methylation domain-containing protein